MAGGPHHDHIRLTGFGELLGFGAPFSSRSCRGGARGSTQASGCPSRYRWPALTWGTPPVALTACSIEAADRRSPLAVDGAGCQEFLDVAFLLHQTCHKFMAGTEQFTDLPGGTLENVEFGEVELLEQVPQWM
ncbi:hypothetical protein FQR65_LT20948 [Abscondita terminalis]|nr:hypothetical protein FQR65_LT20948 [Abscondita terminalis]